MPVSTSSLLSFLGSALVVLVDVPCKNDMENPGGEEEDLEDQDNDANQAASGHGLSHNVPDENESEGSESVHGEWLVASLLVEARGDPGTKWAEADVEDEHDEWHGALQVGGLEELALELVTTFAVDEWLEVVVFLVEHIRCAKLFINNPVTKV